MYLKMNKVYIDINIFLAIQYLIFSNWLTPLIVIVGREARAGCKVPVSIPISCNADCPCTELAHASTSFDTSS